MKTKLTDVQRKVLEAMLLSRPLEWVDYRASFIIQSKTSHDEIICPHNTTVSSLHRRGLIEKHLLTRRYVITPAGKEALKDD